ncbi:Uracil phosphoribosyltransferase -like protein [Echinococcus granulosus]|uniref:Uracil phosphoribosyltransferase n=1 Tax=Echinococcus granulosus TaxID=6210 RepID=A0A068WUF2_ECHGR|nr:Uracil phosphoribosyltransferase -like protein [Echinococcus granulosus]CDS21278.1 uracil phosphoribosyltransferase [Echinococcus granulosus]
MALCDASMIEQAITEHVKGLMTANGSSTLQGSPYPEVAEVMRTFSTNIVLLRQTDEVREMQTVLRDRTTTRNDFVFYANRLIRLVMEEGLNQLPFEEVSVTTPTGHRYNGLKFLRGNCGVSIVRSGEAMERGLRDCCRGLRIGKILITVSEEFGQISEPRVVYAKLPPGIESRKVLLMYPTLKTGNIVLTALELLRSYNVSAENVILHTLFASPQGLKNVLTRNPALTVVTSEVHPVVPSHFDQSYFGTIPATSYPSPTSLVYAGLRVRYSFHETMCQINMESMFL